MEVTAIQWVPWFIGMGMGINVADVGLAFYTDISIDLFAII